MKSAPVLLLGFNRPDFMVAQIDAIRVAHPSKVYIAVDGPRENVKGEDELCRKVRECEKHIDWECAIKKLYRERNYGCKYGVSEAITWFFENEESGIILEDDCRPAPDFFRFATEMLERYRDNEHIGAVCGFNFFNLQSDKTVTYHFSRHMDVWGWASWRRVWKDYNVEVPKDCERLFAMIDGIEATAYYKKFYKGLVCNIKNGFSTWDMQMSLLFMEKGYLSVVPKVRLVANAGLSDNRATHTGGYVYWATEWGKASSAYFPLIHPSNVECDDEADRIRERMEGAILPRGLTWLGVKFPCLCCVLSAAGKVLQKIAPILFRI